MCQKEKQLIVCIWQPPSKNPKVQQEIIFSSICLIHFSTISPSITKHLISSYKSERIRSSSSRSLSTLAPAASEQDSEQLRSLRTTQNITYACPLWLEEETNPMGFSLMIGMGRRLEKNLQSIDVQSQIHFEKYLLLCEKMLGKV